MKKQVITKKVASKSNGRNEERILSQMAPKHQASVPHVQKKVVSSKLESKTLEAAIKEHYTIEFDKKGKKIPTVTLIKYVDLAMKFKSVGIKKPEEVINAITAYEYKVNKLGNNFKIDAAVKISREIAEIHELAKKVDSEDLKKNSAKVVSFIEDGIMKELIKSDAATNKVYVKRLEEVRKSYKPKKNNPLLLEDEKLAIIAAEREEIKNIKQERLIAIKNHNNSMIEEKVQEIMKLLMIMKGIEA